MSGSLPKEITLQISTFFQYIYQKIIYLNYGALKYVHKETGLLRYHIFLKTTVSNFQVSRISITKLYLNHENLYAALYPFRCYRIISKASDSVKHWLAYYDSA